MEWLVEIFHSITRLSHTLGTCNKTKLLTKTFAIYCENIMDINIIKFRLC